MNSKFMAYAIFVTAITTWSSWAGMIRSSMNSTGGSGWSSGYHGGGGYYGGGGGGHK